MDVALVMFKSDGTRHDFPVTKKRVVIGRKNNCDLRIPLSSVSRQHCELLVENGSVTLRDLGSSNGTYHNQTRVQEAQVKAGDQIMVGPVLFTVTIDGQPKNIKPIRSLVQDPRSESGSRRETPSSDDSDIVALAALNDDSDASTPINMDDPISALEQLAEETSLEDSHNMNDDSDEIFFLPDDDEEEEKRSKQ